MLVVKDDSYSATEPGTTQSGVDAGASGSSSDSSFSLSIGGMAAIIVVVVLVAIVGVATAALFFIAKKREWTLKETIRRSARKVVTVLTPKRAEFPDSVKGSRRASRRAHVKIAEDVPPTPRLRLEDVEKGLPQDEVKSKGQK